MVYNCPHCGPRASIEMDAGICPCCDQPCALTDSHGARLAAWGIDLGMMIGRLNCRSDGLLVAEVDLDELDQLAQLADWLQEEGILQQRREAQPPLRLVRSA